MAVAASAVPAAVAAVSVDPALCLSWVGVEVAVVVVSYTRLGFVVMGRRQGVPAVSLPLLD